MVIKYFIIFIHVHPSDCKKRRKMHLQCPCSACKNYPSVAVWNTKNTGGRKVEISRMHKYKSLQRCIETLSRRAVLYCRIWKLRDQHRYGLSSSTRRAHSKNFAWLEGHWRGIFRASVNYYFAILRTPLLLQDISLLRICEKRKVGWQCYLDVPAPHAIPTKV